METALRKKLTLFIGRRFLRSVHARRERHATAIRARHRCPQATQTYPTVTRAAPTPPLHHSHEHNGSVLWLNLHRNWKQTVVRTLRANARKEWLKAGTIQQLASRWIIQLSKCMPPLATRFVLWQVRTEKKRLVFFLRGRVGGWASL